MRRVGAVSAVLVALAALGCGGSPPLTGPSLVLDFRLQQPDEMLTLQGVTLLLDGDEVARFAQDRPESAVVFSKHLRGISPGDHTIELRIDAQTSSPTLYVAKGLLSYDGQRQELPERSGTLATGQSLRFRLRL